MDVKIDEFKVKFNQTLINGLNRDRLTIKMNSQLFPIDKANEER